jgi:acyl-coenzyme A synthetase/AMP-(fatty) acid ligase
VAVTLLLERIQSCVDRAPAQVAIIAEGRVITYRQLLALISNTARLLHERGVRAGDVVGVAMGHVPLQLVTFVALARLGAVALPQYPNLPPAVRAQPLHRFGARWVVADASYPAAGAIPVIALQKLFARGDENDFTFADFDAAPQSPLRIALTSGTVGPQKGLLHTHGEFAARLDRRFYGDTPHPRVIAPPLHITSALQLACHALCTAGTVVFPQTQDAQAFLAAIHLHAITHVNLPPADLAMMLSLLSEDTPAFPSIRHLRIVGATPSPALVQAAQRKFSPHIAMGYSMTEVGVVARGTPETLAQAPGSAGRIAPGARVEVLDENGRVLGPGEKGEIRVAVDGMPKGYHGPDAAQPGFGDGWFHPGDHGHVSPEGFVFIEGRRDSLINVGGHKLAPEFVEAILADHASVAEAAVFPFEDPIAGTQLAAAIVARAGIDWKQFVEYARVAVGASAPGRYFRVEVLPRNAMGKLERRELAGWVALSGSRIP